MSCQLTGVGAAVGARVGAGVGSGVGAFQEDHGSVSTKPTCIYHKQQIWQVYMSLIVIFILQNVYTWLESSTASQTARSFAAYVRKHQLTRVGAGVGAAVGAFKNIYSFQCQLKRMLQSK